MKDIEAEKGRKLSRTEWCKDLFLRLKDDQLVPFLENLSNILNYREVAPATETNEDNNQIDVPTMKKIKIFISHNTEDKEYAAALVEMMHSYGVKYEDIFCTSHPACKIPFGKSILNFRK